MTKTEREARWLALLYYEYSRAVDHPRRSRRILSYLRQIYKIWGLRWY